MTKLEISRILDPFRDKREQRAEVYRALAASGGDPLTFKWYEIRRADLPGNPLNLIVTAFAKEPIDDTSSHD